jgi:hypothetical protein
MSLPIVNHELVVALKRLKLGRIATTLPERLVLAEQQSMSHDDLLLLLLTDEIARREASATDNRVREAGLDPQMRLELWDKTSKAPTTSACSVCSPTWASSKSIGTSSSSARSG